MCCLQPVYFRFFKAALLLLSVLRLSSMFLKIKVPKRFTHDEVISLVLLNTIEGHFSDELLR